MKGKRILITGPPGIGKTTLVKKICDVLSGEHQMKLSGFYTQELREHGERKGFDVVTLDGKTSNLAMKSNLVSAQTKQKSPSVGQYSVNIPSFEKTALPTLQGMVDCTIVIDEIGKMEIFSKPFCGEVRRKFDEHPLHVLATIPIARGKPLQLVDDIKKRDDVKLINVSRENRDELVKDIVIQLLE